MSSKVLITVLVLFSFVAGAAAVTCQRCTYVKTVRGIESGASCKDPYSGDQPTECTGEFCRKHIQTYSEGGISYDYIDRDCAYACIKEGEESGEFGGHKATIYCCKGDNCNSGVALMPALCLLVASLLSTTFF